MTTRFEVPGDDTAAPATRAIGGPVPHSTPDPARARNAAPSINAAPSKNAAPSIKAASVNTGPAIDAAESGLSAEALPRSVPDATVARLATYLRVVSAFAERRVETVSSEELAVAAGVNSAKLRKDLSHLGSYGVRGVGYSVSVLAAQLAQTLGLSEHHRVALIGVGNLGQALSGYDGFATRGFEIAALLDASTERVGTIVRGLVVHHIDELAEVVRAEGISIGIIATPAMAAQEVCDALAAAGVTAILNFAPTVLSVPESVDVRKVDLAAELQILSFHEQRKARGLSVPVSGDHARSSAGRS
jgi:redox-sensing transcriptional repressor